MKNEHAAALGRLKKGTKEKPSAAKSESSRRNAEKARQAKANKKKESDVN